jgi:hypothetical protein
MLISMKRRGQLAFDLRYKGRGGPRKEQVGRATGHRLFRICGALPSRRTIPFT